MVNQLTKLWLALGLSYTGHKLFTPSLGFYHCFDYKAGFVVSSSEPAQVPGDVEYSV